jgi:hypothetical protein
VPAAGRARSAWWLAALWGRVLRYLLSLSSSLACSGQGAMEWRSLLSLWRLGLVRDCDIVAEVDLNVVPDSQL